MLRGPADPAAQPDACKHMTAASLADLYMVRPRGHENWHSLRSRRVLSIHLYVPELLLRNYELLSADHG